VANDLLARMGLVHQPKVTYRDYDEMLADPELDGVIVAIADQFHVAAARKAIEAGKHVLVEKPLGVSVEEVEGLRSVVADSGLVFQIGTMKRLDPGIAFAQHFIAEEMGQLLALKAWYCDSTHRYAMTDNLQPLIETSALSRRPAGNPKADRRRYYMLGHGSHLVDLARFLGGPIEAVRTSYRERFGAHCWFVETHFADGAIGHLDLTIAVRMDWHEGFQVYGEYGSVIGKTYNPWYLRSSDVECFSERDGQYHRLLGADAHVYKLQVEGFAEAILTGEPTRGATIDDGVAAVRAMVSIARSSETGALIRLADVTGSV
jgi:predicted dehydrogenase